MLEQHQRSESGCRFRGRRRRGIDPEEVSKDGEEEALYEIVDDDDELNAVARVFQEMLDDVELE